MSQNTEILAHLQDGNTLTPLQALRLCGSMRLAARIDDLRSDGHDIKTELVYVKKGTRVARYSLNDAT